MEHDNGDSEKEDGKKLIHFIFNLSIIPQESLFKMLELQSLRNTFVKETFMSLTELEIDVMAIF